MGILDYGRIQLIYSVHIFSYSGCKWEYWITAEYSLYIVFIFSHILVVNGNIGLRQNTAYI